MIRHLLTTLFFVCLSTSQALKAEAEMIKNPIGIIYSSELKKQLHSALKSKGKNYTPRTEHLNENGSPIYTNRLILESSPYLIQHAHNPVDWYSWGEQAFAEAKQQNKPIFLSIGYSTCHWCHVMERESFDNPEIATILNKHFIAIKVDREQHPDIDSTYMMGVILLTGRGGWPLSSFVTPQGNTFHGGTYFPPEQFANLLTSISNAWKNNRNIIENQANQIARAVRSATSDSTETAAIGKQILNTTWQNLNKQHDKVHGGFGGAPKFPNESSLLFLLERARLLKDEYALYTALHALDAMAQGGIYDQVGGGFHRYATDKNWLIPHFEKMLYNQALLTRSYIEAYQLTHKTHYRRIVEQTLDYVLREMTSPQGGFYSATDADSEGEEGLFFIWTVDELKQALNKEESQLAIDLFEVTAQGNFEGRNILYLPQSIEHYAKAHSLNVEQLYSRIDTIREKLRTKRSKRIPPLRDDKIILAWNGMMITAFAEAGHTLNREDYIQAAEQAADFLLKDNRDEKGRLYRINLSGKPSIEATQEDYAYFSEALIKLYDISKNEHWLKQAQLLTDDMIAFFWDNEQGGFFMNVESTIPVMSRPKDSTDNASPSGNSVALRVLSQLSKRIESHKYKRKANELIKAFSSEIQRIPHAFTYMMVGISELLHNETHTIQYAGNGHVRIELVKSDSDNLNLNISMDEGWHINANKPLQDFLIPTTVKLSENSPISIEEVLYPKEIIKRLGFQQEQLALYEGQQTIIIKIRETNKPTAKSASTNKGWPFYELKLQACNANTCLTPETLKFDNGPT